MTKRQTITVIVGQALPADQVFSKSKLYIVMGNLTASKSTLKPGTTLGTWSLKLECLKVDFFDQKIICECSEPCID